MTNEEKIKLANAIKVVKREKAKKSYYEYVKYVRADYEYQRHGEYICQVMQDALDKRDRMLSGEIKIENQYIMLSMPPRHGKSMHVTETLPSYFMGKYPKSKVILTAYSSTLAQDFAKANSDKIKQHKVFNNNIEQDNQERTLLDNGSTCVKAGILGGITGKGAHLMIIDDPIKTAEEARSEVHREKVWREWISSLSTRLEKAAIVIVIMTRWHEDDLIGRLLNSEYAEPLPWQVINLPLEAEENDILGRKVGEPLWPERYGYDFIEVRKRYPYDFNALYQGRPTSQEGNIIKRDSWKYYDYSRAFINTLPLLCLSVDASFTDSTQSAKVSIQVWGKLGANCYQVDNYTHKLNFTGTIQAIKNMLQKYPRIGAKYIEAKANGEAIIDVLNREVGGFIPVKADASTGGKVARVYAIEPFITAGNVYLPRGEGCEWVHNYVEEMSSFPNGQYKDQVDATSQVLWKLFYFIAELEEKKVNPLPSALRSRETPKHSGIGGNVQGGFTW